MHLTAEPRGGVYGSKLQCEYTENVEPSIGHDSQAFVINC